MARYFQKFSNSFAATVSNNLFSKKTFAAQSIKKQGSIAIDFISEEQIEEQNLRNKTTDFYLPLMKELTSFIANLSVKIALLKVNSQILPIVIAHDNYEDSYICSMYGHYVCQGLQAPKLLTKSLLQKASKKILHFLGKVIKKGVVNRIIYVNHSLFSTDLHPALTKSEIESIKDFLTEAYPDYAIVFRSINQAVNASLNEALKANNFNFIASRQIFLTDTKEEAIFKTRIIKSDLKLWEKHKFSLEPALSSSEECQQIEKNYHNSIIGYHSALNPQFTIKFIKHLIDSQWLELQCLKIDDRLEGVISYRQEGNLFTCPLIGFNKDHEDHSKIYRLLSTSLLLEARKNKLLFHQSAGASFYKKLRRATGHIDFFAVYNKNLSLKRRFYWKILQFFGNYLAQPFMKKY